MLSNTYILRGKENPARSGPRYPLALATTPAALSLFFIYCTDMKCKYIYICNVYIYIYIHIDQKLLNQTCIISLLFDALSSLLSQANPYHVEACWDRSSMHLARSWWEATLDSAGISSVSAKTNGLLHCIGDNQKTPLKSIKHESICMLSVAPRTLNDPFNPKQ